MKKPSLIEGGQTPIDTSRRDLAERNAQPVHRAIDGKKPDDPRAKTGRPKTLK